MPENIGTGSNSPYNTRIPSITDNADIQTALRLYHYGSDTSTPTTIPEESIAGHLGVIDSSKLDKNPQAIPAQTDLDTLEETGFYVQLNNETANNDPNYPVGFAGLLSVVNTNGVIFQEYQAVGAQEPETGVNLNNKTYWRFKFYDPTQATLVWSKWRTFLEQGEFTDVGDARYVRTAGGSSVFISNYYTKTEADNKFLTLNQAQDLRYSIENVVTNRGYTLTINDIGKIVAVNGTGDYTITIPRNSSVGFPVGTIINIYNTSPYNVVVKGDTGVTVRPFADNQFRLFDRYVEVSIRKRSTDEWVASGNILEV